MHPVELMDKKATCRFFGGSKPIDPATLYRGIKAGIYPKPIKVAPKTSRWLPAECEDALARMIAQRDDAAHKKAALERRQFDQAAAERHR